MTREKQANYAEDRTMGGRCSLWVQCHSLGISMGHFSVLTPFLLEIIEGSLVLFLHVAVTTVTIYCFTSSNGYACMALKQVYLPRVFHTQQPQMDSFFFSEFSFKLSLMQSWECYVESFTVSGPSSKHTYVPRGNVRKLHILGVNSPAVKFSQFSK